MAGIMARRSSSVAWSLGLTTTTLLLCSSLLSLTIAEEPAVPDTQTQTPTKVEEPPAAPNKTNITTNDTLEDEILLESRSVVALNGDRTLYSQSEQVANVPGSLSDLRKGPNLWATIEGQGSMAEVIPAMLEIRTINCTAPLPNPLYADNKTCLAGIVPPRTNFNWSDLKPKERAGKRAPWYLPIEEPPGQPHPIDDMERVIRECSPNCASKICSYNMDVLDFVCGNGSAQETAAELDSIRFFHMWLRLIPDDHICWEGAQFGKKYDPLTLTPKDWQMAEWLASALKGDKHKLYLLERRLSINCLSKDCSFVPEKAVFLCGGYSDSYSKTSRRYPTPSYMSMLLGPLWIVGLNL
jgi:hypothetical protein